MIKVSKYLWIFLGLFGVLTILIFGAGEKYLPFLFHKTIYLCKHVIEATPLKPLQGNFKLITASVILALLIYVVVRLAATAIGIFKEKLNLTQKAVMSERINLISAKLGLQNQIRVIKDDKLLAFCFGVFNPKIYLSTKMVDVLSISELEVVIRHEQYHLLNKDTFVMLFAKFGALLFPFLPLISDITHRYLMQREVQADLFAHANISARKKDLIAVLIKILSSEPSPALLLASNLGEYETLELRINLLLERNSSYPSFSVSNILISVLSLLLLGILFVTPVRAIEYHAEGQDAVMACIDPFGSCKNACEFNTILPNSTQNASHPYSSSSFSSSSY